MKITWILFLLLISAVTRAQDTTMTISDVVQVDSVRKDDLFIQAQKWFSEIYRDSKSVLQITDKEAGVLTGKANFYYEGPYVGSALMNSVVTYTISVYVKDGRYKYEIGNFNHLKTLGLLTSSDIYPYQNKTMESKKWMDKSWRKVKERSNEEANRLASSLQAAMTTKSTHGGDW